MTTVYSDSEDCDDLDESSQAESNNDDGNKECDSDSDGLYDETTSTEVDYK